MKRRKIWLVVAVLFFLANVGGAVFAAAVEGDLPHAGVHVVLALLGGYAVRRLASRRDSRQDEIEMPDASPELTERLTHLEQSVEAVAIEVERIGEGQRFMTRVLTESGTSQPPGEIKASEAAPRVPRS